jgi:2-polyprenyl-6-methoxyphenol hydroxylase-like FAD-dependent oxidoreductase
MLTDRTGRSGDGSVAAGLLPPEREAALKARAAGLLPPAFADVVEAARDTFIQAIFTVNVPGYRHRQVCLVGDAGTLFPPFTGSGVFKAISNAVELADALAAEPNVHDALAAWNNGQLQHAATFGQAADRFERSLIFSMPDLVSMTDDEFTAWSRAMWADATAPMTPSATPAKRVD